MTMYCFYQSDFKGSWKLALAAERNTLVRDKGAALITALDVDNDFSDKMTLEEQLKLKQTGDLFFDFDDSSLDNCITQVKVFLTNLKAKNVDLNQIRIYATGGRGFHVFIPMGMYLGKPPANGIQGLVHIYQEMAFQLYVDSMDMRIYSTRKGRMMRCENVKRENGKYKVQITADEALDMTESKYEELCAAPRATWHPDDVRLNSELALMYAQAKDKVEKALRKKKDNRKKVEALAKFNGEWPETVQLILQGVGIIENIGWNSISLQLAIISTLLGKTEEQLIADAEPVINSHKGDGKRYGSAFNRREDLRQMYRYVQGNPCYEYSPGGILALLIPEVRGNSDLTRGDYIEEVKPQATPAPKVGEPDKDAPLDTSEARSEAKPEDDPSRGLGVRVNKFGIYVMKDAEWSRVSHVGFANPECIRNLQGEYLGYELDPYVEGKKRGRTFLPANTFTGKASFNGWAITLGSSMTASDTQTTVINDYLRRMTEKNGTKFALTREGVDLVTPPDAPQTWEMVWARPGEVITASEKTHHYRFHGINNADGTYRSDLMTAPDLTEEDAKFFENLFQINTPRNLGKLLGWFSAAFLTQLIRKIYRAYPSLQVYGQAGAGKSMTVALLNGLHYYMAEPRQLSVSGQTQFPILVAMATSASMPLVFEEVKARQLTKQNMDFLQNLLRSNYMGDRIERGSLARDTTKRGPEVNSYDNGAPIVFVGEAIDSQTAILERCVLVDLSKSDRLGRSKYFNYCLENRFTLGKLGRQMVRAALRIPHESVKDTLRKHREMLESQIKDEEAEDTSRPIYNLSVVLTGLDFLKSTLNAIYPDRFNDQIESMMNALTERVQDNLPETMSEASKVLHTMAFMSRTDDPNYKLLPGTDYIQTETHLDLKMRNAYVKYARFQRSIGAEVLFDTENAFIVGMRNYSGVVHTKVIDSPLWDSPQCVVYRFSLAKLAKEKVDAFL